jgi:hypothetical protein
MARPAGSVSLASSSRSAYLLVRKQAFVSDRVIRVLAWGLAAFFLGHALVSFVEGWVWSMQEWWLYGPSGLVLGLLALVVAHSGAVQKRHVHTPPTQPLPSH